MHTLSRGDLLREKKKKIHDQRSIHKKITSRKMVRTEIRFFHASGHHSGSETANTSSARPQRNIILRGTSIKNHFKSSLASVLEGSRGDPGSKRIPRANKTSTNLFFTRSLRDLPSAPHPRGPSRSLPLLLRDERFRKNGESDAKAPSDRARWLPRLGRRVAVGVSRGRRFAIATCVHERHPWDSMTQC